MKSKEVTLRDEKRGREIDCRVQDPEAGDRIPLVVFSQELGADKTACAVISQRVAENGYVIVHPDHGDGFGRSGIRQGVYAGKSCAGGIGEPRSAGG